MRKPWSQSNSIGKCRATILIGREAIEIPVDSSLWRKELVAISSKCSIPHRLGRCSVPDRARRQIRAHNRPRSHNQLVGDSLGLPGPGLVGHKTWRRRPCKLHLLHMWPGGNKAERGEYGFATPHGEVIIYIREVDIVQFQQPSLHRLRKGPGRWLLEARPGF